MNNPFRGLVFFLALSVSSIGCAGSSSDCEEFNKNLCEKACSCTQDPECHLFIGAAYFTFDSYEECIDERFAVCEQEMEVDWAICQANLDEKDCAMGPVGKMGISLDNLCE